MPFLFVMLAKTGLQLAANNLSQPNRIIMDNIALYSFRALSVLSLSLVLTACGGGGGGSKEGAKELPPSSSAAALSSSAAPKPASSSLQSVTSSSVGVASSVKTSSSKAVVSSSAVPAQSSSLPFEPPPVWPRSSSSYSSVTMSVVTISRSSVASSSVVSSSAIASSVVVSSSIASSSVVSNSSSIASSSMLSSLSSSKSSSLVSSSSSSKSSVTIFHLRGTQTTPHFVEGDVFTPVAGSTTTLEICRNFTAIPSGVSRFKVDPNGGWGGDEFPASDTPTTGWTRIVIKNDNSKTIVSLNKNLAVNCGAVASSSSVSSSSLSSSVVSSSVKSSSSSVASSSSSAAEVVAHDFRARTAYYVMLDRFNGSTLSASVLPASADADDWKKYWGGDIDGLIAKLPYLNSLGVNAIVVSSLVDNTALGYHGFWAKDYYAVDEHLAKTFDKVKELKAKMKALDMKLVMEITLNNSSGEAPNPGALLKSGQPVVGVDSFANGVAAGWYRNTGSITDDEWYTPAKYLTKSVSGRPDFIQGSNGSNSVADQYLIDAAKFWMAGGEGVDGFRIHLTKFIDPGFVTRFAKAVREQNPEAYIVGDWPEAAGDIPLVKAFVKARQGSELMDIDLRNHLEAAIAGDDTMVELSAHLKARQLDLGDKASLQAIYLDSSSDSRTSVVLRTSQKTSRGTGKGMSQAKAEARQNIGTAMVMTLPGVPVIYYGSEANVATFTANAAGDLGGDPFNREKMTFAATPKPAFSMISKLSSLRKVSSALQQGGYEERWVNDDVLVYQRQSADGDCAVVAINRGAAMTAPINVKKLCLADASYSNALNVADAAVVVSGGIANITLKENQVVVLYPEH